jgi:hypothetical protein
VTLPAHDDPFEAVKLKEIEMKKIVNQHGDLLLEAVDSIPADAKRIEVSAGYIMERGEGVHTHIFPDVSGIEVYEGPKGEIYVRVVKSTELDHEEHGRQTVKPRIIKKGIERVWDYESSEARRTID